MHVLLVALHAVFFLPLLLRVVSGRAGALERPAELAAGARAAALVLHGAGLVSLWAGVGFALATGRVTPYVTLRGALGAVLVVGGAVLMAWSAAALRSWRLLPRIDASHELCTTGPYAVIRHPMYLALDLLGLGTAVWTGAPAVLGAVLLVVGGDLRARREERALLDAFGERYRDYMRRVRRTIPFVY